MKQIRPSLAFMALLPSLAILFACSSGGNDDDYKYVAPSSSSVAAAPSSSSVPGTPSSSSGGGGLSSSSSDDTPVELAVTGGITLNFGNSHGVYFLGTENPYTGTYSITNAEAAGCGEISYFVREGSINEPGKYEVCARVTCAKTIVPDNILPGCKEAQVVADPSISSCAFAENENAVKKDAAPLPVPKVGSINSDYGRCVAEFSPYSSAAVKVFDVTANCKGYSATTSCGTFTVSLTDPPITHGFAFAGEFYKDGNDTTYSIGKTIDYSGLTIDNPGADKADCGSIVYAIQSTATVTKGSAAPSVTAATPIKVTATVECGISSSNPKTWTYEINARIVPNPVLSCSWGAVSSIKADEGNATPVVAVANNFGRCSAVSAATYSDGFVPGKIAAPTTVETTATLACANLGTSAITADCPALTVNPADRKVTGEVNFTAASKVFTFSGNQHYSIGATPGAEGNVAITNATAADCGAVSYETSGTTAVANNEIKAIAYATCDGSKVELRSKTATVVANPSISACYWTAGADTVTSAYKNVFVTPKATISNNYDRCTAPVPDNSSYNPLVVSANVAAGAAKMVSTCTNVTPASLSSNCPALTALEGSARPTSASGECDAAGTNGKCQITVPADNGTNNLWSNTEDYIKGKLVNPINNMLAAKCGDIKITRTGAGSTGIGSITIAAEVECHTAEEPGGKITYKLGSVTATVVAAPTITTCAWDAAANVIVGTAPNQYVVQDAVVNAKATVNNCFGRCTDGAQTTPVVTSAVKDNVGLIDVKVTPTGVGLNGLASAELKATCGNATAKTGTALEVKAQPKCDAYLSGGTAGTKKWNDICGNVSFYDVKWNVLPTVSGGRVNGGSEACYWVQNMVVPNSNYGFQNLSGWKLNGTTFNSDGGDRASMNNIVATGKIDGGLYIYIPAHTTQVNSAPTANSLTAGSKPYCAGGAAPTLICALGTMSVLENSPIDLLPKLSCSDGTAPSTPSLASSSPALNLASPVKGDYSLTAKAKCGGTNGLEVTDICAGSLKVIGLDQACEGQKDLAKYCPDVTSWDDVKWNVIPSVVQFGGSVGGKLAAGCFYVKSWNQNNSNIGSNNNLTFRINGEPFTGDQNNTQNNAAPRNALNSRVDDGIYIWIKSEGTTTPVTSGGVTYNSYSVAGNNFNGANNLTAGTSAPYCKTGVRTLTCGAVPGTGIVGNSVTAPPLTCNDGALANQSYTSNGSSINFASLPAAGTYGTIKATASCGVTTGLTADCSGSIVVSPITLICGAVPASGITGGSVAAPTLTCNTGATPGSPSYTSGGTPFSFAALPEVGTYPIVASATCNSQSLTANCTGSIKVEPEGTQIYTPLSFGNAVDQKAVEGGKSYILTYTGNNAACFRCNTKQDNNTVPTVGTVDGVSITASNNWGGKGTCISLTGINDKILVIDMGVPSALVCGSDWN